MLGKTFTRFGRFLACWAKCRKGSVAVEFSLVAIPFYLLTIGIIELSLMFTNAVVLEGATSMGARLMRTGQIQNTTSDTSQQLELMRQAICGSALILVGCEDELIVESINLGSFSNMSNYDFQRDENGQMVSQGFQTGDENDIMLLRVGYTYRLMTPFIGQLLGENGSGERLFISTIVHQIEPYNPSADPEA